MLYIFWITISVSGCILMFYISNSHKNKDVFNPFYLIMALYILYFIVGPYIWISRGQTSYMGFEIMQGLPKASIVTITAIISFSIGVMLKCTFVVGNRQNTKNNQLDYDNNRNYIVRYAIVWFLIGFVCALIYYRSTNRSLLSMLSLGRLGSSMSESALRVPSGVLFLSCFIRCTFSASMLLLVFCKKKFLPIICYIVTALITISTGSRNLAMTAIFPIFIFVYVNKKKRPKIFTLIVVLILLYIGMGVMGTWRMAMRSGTTLVKVESDDLLTSLMYNVEIFFPFFSMVDYFPRVFNYNWGLGIINIFVQFIPRAIWSNKPTFLGTDPLRAIYGSDLGGAAYPNFGAYYIEFGIIGVVVGQFMLGHVANRIFCKGTNSDDVIDKISFSIFFVYLLQLISRGSLSNQAIDIVFMFLPLWILRSRLKKRRGGE